MSAAEASGAPLAGAERWRDTPAPAEFLARNAPEIATEEVPRCPVCDHEGCATFAVGFDYELLTCRNPWRFTRCEECGHAWLNPRPAISTLSIIYPPSYYAYSYEDTINSIAVRGKALLDRLKVRGILRHLASAPRSYLDIGCGSGRFLKTMEGRGVARTSLYGLELDQRVVDALSAQGYQVACKRVEDCETIPPGQIDLATMFHVIEHVDDPAAVVRKIAEWLAPGGVLALETPNLDSLDARSFKSGFWGGYHIPRHWHVFTPASLKLLLERAGFDVVTTQYQTGHSFWMYSLHHSLRYGKHPSPGLARLFDPFKGLLPLLVMFTGFDKVRAALSGRTSAMLMIARKKAA